MRILLIGGGGREHAIAWKLMQSRRVKWLAWAPGNGAPGPADELVPIPPSEVGRLVRHADKMAADLVIVGPEVPLAEGIWDALTAKGIPTFGPSQAAARIESSKVFAKEFCVRHGIPTPGFTVFDSAGEAASYLEGYEGPFPVVLKADGLAAGKGVLICKDREEALAGAHRIMGERAFGTAGDRMVVEEFQEGEEASLMVFTDGETVVPMPVARDYKRALDGDGGLNTGGMGAYCPSSRVSPEQLATAMERVIVPAVTGLAKEGHPYRGVLYAGLMLTGEGPKVLEFNCRFGDPETQVVLPLLQSDLAEIAMGCATGDLSNCRVDWKIGAAVTVVLCSGGYPVSYRKGMEIHGLEEAARVVNTVLFHAGTRREEGRVVTAGGRVLNVTALGTTVAEARKLAYATAGRVSFEGMAFRTDIAGEL